MNYSDVIPGLIGLITRISVNNVHLADTVMFTIGALKTSECSVSNRRKEACVDCALFFLLLLLLLFSPGALAEWLADHPVMLGNVLPLVLHALGNPDLSISSVSTLKKICRECKSDLPPYANNIVAVSQVMRTHSGFLVCAIAYFHSVSSVTANFSSCQSFDSLPHDIGSCNLGAFYTNGAIKMTFFFSALKEVLIKQIHKVSLCSRVLFACFSSRIETRNAVTVTSL